MLQFEQKNPQKALNQAYRKERVLRSDIDRFKQQFVWMFDKLADNPNESEENRKNIVADWLKNTFYSPNYELNTKGREDLVIHAGKSAQDAVAVLFEVKKPGSAEMPSLEKPNAKALQQLILYYLTERTAHKNIGVRHLIITDVYGWWVFDEHDFDKLFYRNATLMKGYETYKQGGKDTEFFYKEVASPFLEASEAVLQVAFFDLRTYETTVRNADMNDDRRLIALYKLLSPTHLLKLPFANDSNSLDRHFYAELLHIIGLEEVKDGGKKLIKRKARPDEFSLLENALTKIVNKGVADVPDLASYGANREEQVFSIGLELVITWVNRVLFLKLLEAQLSSYHPSERGKYKFLNSTLIHDFDRLGKLFFEVLAVKIEDRKGRVRDEFGHIPYLNSSLFERTPLERILVGVNDLDDHEAMPVLPNTVLKDEKGQRKTGGLPALDYLLAFLEAYDFASEGTEDIQEDKRTLINASVLGLIFEKINGYKDGSFFTPGFITMYMCRETLRRAVVQKFNETKGWTCDTLDDVYAQIKDKKEANELVNSLKICDPAVGSGHFLVSALNELIAIKHDLGILMDGNGKTLRDYTVVVSNDELTVTDDDGNLFEYRPKSPESQRVQQTLFREKQTLIEGCLFGVDINPNSVKICRLRLWIELLKNAYYRPDGQLETLPNIDINIKQGNSLISRFALDADLKTALKKSNWSIEMYRLAVQQYRAARGRDEKQELVRLLEKIKTDFRSEIGLRDPKLLKMNKLGGDLFTLLNQTSLFGETKAEAKTKLQTKEKLEADIRKLAAEVEEIKTNKIYNNAFEWRFEFPEVLDNEGQFVGFDVVMGNPPYIRQEEISWMKPHLQQQFETYAGTADMYVFFVELGMRMVRSGGQFVYILPNKWMRAGYGKAMREYLKRQRIFEILDFGDLPVFDEAITYPCILSLGQSAPTTQLQAAQIQTLDFDSLAEYSQELKYSVEIAALAPDGWTLSKGNTQALLNKIKAAGTPLGAYVEGQIYYGIKTGYNDAFVIDTDTKNRLIAEDPTSEEIIKPFLAGRDVKRYQKPKSDKWLILFKNGWTKQRFAGELAHLVQLHGHIPEQNAWQALCENYPAITKFLSEFRDRAIARTDKGEYWWELRACAYYNEFEREKIIYPNICKMPEFTIEKNAHYGNQKCFIISSTDKYLLGVLNSSVIYYLFKKILPKLRGDFYEPSSVYFKEFPIPAASPAAQAPIIALVEGILSAKAADPQADTSVAEAEIDALVYGLYGLTEAEVAVVCG